MALQTPKQRTTGLQRPSFSHLSTSSSPTLRASTTDINRKASLQALTGQAPTTPSNGMDGELEVGDAVNVPGDMHGTVKFVGSVKGKAGRFVGVELAPQFAPRGKNDGDVDGVKYFRTSISGAGIFLPVHRAERRSSLPTSEATAGTPTTPSHSTYNGRKVRGADATFAPTTPAIKPNFSQSVGPGARPPSPSLKAKRPSLPRPESPLRKQPTLAPTPGRGLSQSQAGSRPSVGQTPSKAAFKSSTSSRPPVPTTSARPYSRNGSRLGHRSDTIDENDSVAGRGMAFSQTMRSPSRQGSAGGQEEVQRLRAQLLERDQRLNEQAASLAEMEQSVKELSALLPADGAMRSPTAGDGDDRTAAQLRQTLREKNEKISKLTAEFDAHRADFRSTLDSLEMASTETERVYEEQKRDLLAQLADLQEAGQSKEDFESVAQQLKQLEEFVAELEEGLEESRRGEAEARGEVEFLRGEVERGRSELRREREKAAAAMKHASITSSGSSTKDLEQRDDEIRGLKAIIHSLSESGNTPDTKTTSSTNDEDEIKRLQKALDEMRLEKDSLENEVEQLHRERAYDSNANTHIHARNESQLTEKAPNGRPRSNTVKPLSPSVERLPNGSNKHNSTAVRGNDEPAAVYCEMCNAADHDTLECTELSNNAPAQAQQKSAQHDAVTIHKPQTTDMGKENHIVVDHDAKAEAHLSSDADKWCALCEKDGHLAFDCPEEQY